MMNLQYPIGRFAYPDSCDESQVQSSIDDIAQLPHDMAATVNRLSPEQLALPYRPYGWTGYQVIHHVPDSHMQAYCRFKLALTESTPTIKPYREDLWAQLPDTHLAPVHLSIDLLSALHERWVILLRNMHFEDFSKDYWHPEYARTYTLGAILKLYAWHGKHHLAHLELLQDDPG